MNRDVATILVLSEDRERAKFIRSILVRAGHWASLVHTHEEAIQVLLDETNEIPLMVMDLKEKLPGSPLQAVLSGHRPDTKFIYLSDAVSERALQELNKNSFWPIISSSFAPGEFLRMVDIVLKFEASAIDSKVPAVKPQSTVNSISKRPTKAELRTGFPVLANN